jgi:hypothetical protein
MVWHGEREVVAGVADAECESSWFIWSFKYVVLLGVLILYEENPV